MGEFIDSAFYIIFNLYMNIQKLKLDVVIIVATVLVNNLRIVSRNTKDFQHIEGLAYLNPHKI